MTLILMTLAVVLLLAHAVVLWAVIIAGSLHRRHRRVVRPARVADPRRIRELEAEAAVPDAEIIRRAEQVAIDEMRPTVNVTHPVSLVASIEPETGNRWFMVPQGVRFLPSCEDCDWIETRTMDGRVVTRYRIPCERHARDQL